MKKTRTSGRNLGEIRAISRVMDTAIRIPGTKIRLGADALLGLIPGAGDGVGMAISLYLIFRARQVGVRRGTLAKMVGNVLLDSTLGAIPIAGDVFDVFFKANRRNLELLLQDNPERVDDAGDVPQERQ